MTKIDLRKQLTDDINRISREHRNGTGAGWFSAGAWARLWHEHSEAYRTLFPTGASAATVRRLLSECGFESLPAKFVKARFVNK